MWPFKQVEYEIFVYGSGISKQSFEKSGIKFTSYRLSTFTMDFKRVFTMPSIYGTGAFCTLIPDVKQEVFGAVVTMNRRSYKKFLKRERNYQIVKTTINEYGFYHDVTFVINRNQPTTKVMPNPNYIRTIRNSLNTGEFDAFLSTSYIGDKETSLKTWYKDNDNKRLVDYAEGDY